MISNGRFVDITNHRLRRDLRNPDNRAQLNAVMHDDDRVLSIVAGPGSGKTTVLVLRALRFVFVDDILPEHILITTFTRKAARELRTRWLDWGTAISAELASEFALDRVDLNRCRIDTLDSIVQQALTEHRLPGTLAPIVAETSASNLILKRTAFQALYHENQSILDPLFSRYTFDGQRPRNRGEALRVAKILIDRLIEDRVDLCGYAQSGHAQSVMVEMLTHYRQQALSTNIFDFSLLEEVFSERLSDGSLNEWLGDLRVILIDEYQDTNPLQEEIYFSMIGAVRPAVTVVGDDDQAMYRFRGGSVELFTSFSERCLRATGRQTLRIDMTRNFRSRPEIVQFYNAHITSDPSFATARINPAKPLVVPSRASENVPVLGMFRADPASLASELATFLATLLEHRRIMLNGDGLEISMTDRGALGDAVLLAHSIEEMKYDRYNSVAEERFPGLLRNQMRMNGLQIFNPRGRALRTIPPVAILLGLLLLAIDPDDTTIDEVMPTNEARFFLGQWRAAAQGFLSGHPFPNDGPGLGGFIQAWQRASSGQTVRDFPRDWPTLELVFKLISWLPSFQSDSEHQVWLEAIARIISSAGMASPYGMLLLQNTATSRQGDHVRRSRLSLVRDALLPIAENEVEVDEDIMPSVPRGHMQLMTIHQAKGLEFPLVIVDVGSHFTRNHHTQRFLRFPDRSSNVVSLEDDIEAHLATPLRSSREGVDRTFDDLVRLYYVAYSRPQSVLMLVGCENCLRYGSGQNHATGAIPHIALGWRRDSSWPWRQPFVGRRPPVRVIPPMLLI